MKILITGAAGFLARELVRELEARNHTLTLLDRVDPQEATVFVPGQYERAHVPLQTNWPYVRAEITDAAAICAAVEGHDAVIHLAAAVSGLPARGIETMQANVVGTYTVLDAARQASIKRFLCASSVNAFGTFYWRLSQRPIVYTSLPLDESFPPEPEDPYSLSKLFNEETCAAFTRAYGMTTAAFRFAGMWSSEQYEATRSRPLASTIAWSADLYHWAHVADIAQGLRRAVEHPDLPQFGVYTLSAADTRCPEPTLELVERFQPQLLDKLTAPLPERTALLSIEHAQRSFGYEPEYRLGT